MGNELLIEITGNKIFRILLIMAVGYFLIKINSKLFTVMNKNNLIHIKFTKSVVNGVITVIAIYIIGITIPALNGFINTIIASTSLLVVVAGFAAQEALSNVLNGLMISIFKPFNIGDRVKLVNSDLAGYVEDITLRHTVIKTFTNSRVIVPNSVINKETIENSYYYETTTSMFVDVIIDYSSNLSKAKKIMKKAIESNNLVLREYNIDVQVRELGIHGVCLRAPVWTNDVDTNFRACSEVRETIKREFDKANIKFATSIVNTDKGE